MHAKYQFPDMTGAVKKVCGGVWLAESNFKVILETLAGKMDLQFENYVYGHLITVNMNQKEVE